MKNDKVINIAASHQISLLEKYYDVDREKKEINVKFYYDKASELLNFSIGDVGKEMFNNEVFEKITSVTDQFPSDFKANVFFVVNDFEGYTVDVLNEKLKDVIDINNYQITKNRKYTWLTAAILVLVAFSLLIVLGIAKTYSWFGTGIKKEVYEEMLDITSWVFLWQAVTILFLAPTELSRLGFKIVKEVKTVSFMDKDLNVLSTLNKEELLDNWDTDSKIKSSRKIILLVSSTIVFALGLYSLIETIVNIFTLNKITGDDVFSTIFDLIVDSFYILGAMGGFYKYLNKLRFRVISKIFSVLLGILITLSFILQTIDFDLKNFILNIISMIVYAVFIYSILVPDKKVSLTNEKKTKENNKAPKKEKK